MTDNNQESKIISKGLFWSIIFICILISGGILLLFFLNREYGCEYPVDNGLFGTYGDFIGGVVGTIVAFYSAFLLVKTLQSQEKVNQSVIETNNQISIASGKELYNTLLEVFNNKFERFMTCYQKAIDNYVIEKNNELLMGRKAFEKIASEFICNDFTNNNDYLRRTQSAISEYMDFYSNNRLYLAVHFRMLYLLTSLVSTSGLETNDKVLYAKLIRGQLSESEMTMLRYNCHSEYGVKMQKYCNEFNLIKHLPVMQLLEFKMHYNILKSAIDGNVKELVVGLDTMFITLRKYAKMVLDKDSQRNITYNGGKRYSIVMSVTEDRKKFTLELKIDSGAERRGSGRLSSVEKALDCYDSSQLEQLFRDYLSDLFYASNFYLYNGKENVSKGNFSENGDIITYTFVIEHEKRLALSSKQMAERGRNILES